MDTVVNFIGTYTDALICQVRLIKSLKYCRAAGLKIGSLKKVKVVRSSSVTTNSPVKSTLVTRSL